MGVLNKTVILFPLKGAVVNPILKIVLLQPPGLF